MALKNLNQMSTLGGGGTILNSSTNRGSEFLLRQEEEKKKAEEKRRAQIRALDELEAEAGFRNLSQNKNAPVAQNFGTVGQNKPLSAVGRNNLGLSGKVISPSVESRSNEHLKLKRAAEDTIKGWQNEYATVGNTGIDLLDEFREENERAAEAHIKNAIANTKAGAAEIADLGVTAAKSIKGGLDFTKATGGGTKGMPTLGVPFEEHDTRTFGEKIIQNDSKAVLKDIKKDASTFAEGAEDYKKQYLTSGNTLTDKAEAEIEAVKKEYEDVLGSGAGALIGDVVGSTARQLPRLVISAIPGFGTAAATATMFATASNSAYKDALLNDATDEEAKMYSILAGAVEAGGEYAIGGILGQGTGYLDDLLKISKKITNPIARTAANIFGSSVGEGFEEMAQSVLTTIVQRITYDPDAKVDFTELAYEGLIGALSAGLMSGVNFRGQYRGAKNEIGQIQAEKALGTMSSEDILSAIDSVHETAVELGQEEQFNAALLSVYEKAYGDKASFTERLKNNAKKILDPETEAKANSLGILSTADLSEDAKIAVAKAAAKYGVGTAGTRVTGMQTGTDLGSIGEAERLSKLTGSKVVFYDEGIVKGGIRNGFLDNDGIIHVNRQAKNPLAVVLSHELTHTLEGSSSYDDLSYIVFKTLRESGTDIGQMIDDRMTLYAKHNVSLTEEDARREIVADYVSENFMGSEEQIRNIVAQDRPLAVRIREFFDRVLARFGNAGAQERVQEYDRVREIRDAYKRALGERVTESTVPITENAYQGVRYSLSGNLANDLDNVLAGKFDSASGEVLIGTTSNFLTDVIGAEPLTVTMPANKAYSAMVTEEQAKLDGKYDPNVNYHGLGNEGLVRVLDASENPVAVFAAAPSADNPRRNRLVIVTDEIINGANAVVIEEMSSKSLLNNKRITANKTITAYDRMQILSDINTAATDGRLLYYDKKRSLHNAGVPGSNYPTAIRNANFDNNIANFWNNVKWVNENKSGVYTVEAPAQESAFAKALREAEERKDRKNKKFSISPSENTETAKQHFGTTRDWAETGYLLTDGTQLDFSGRHWGGDGGYREVDHRDINEALGEDIPGNEAMVSFMAEGNIRISPETGGINISMMPTKEQERALRSFVREYGGEVILDIDNENGVTVSSTEYPAKTSAEKVINDIRAYFETGATPVVSDLGRFRQYSISEADGETRGEDSEFADYDLALLQAMREDQESRRESEEAETAAELDYYDGSNIYDNGIGRDGNVVNWDRQREAFDELSRYASDTNTDAQRRVYNEMPRDTMGMIVGEQSKPTLKERVQSVKKGADNAYSAFMRKMVDSGYTVDRISKAVGSPALYHSYNMARASANAGMYMIEGKQTDVAGNVVGDGLNDVLKPVREKGDGYYREFQDYLLHLHNQDRMSRQNLDRVERAKKAFTEFVEAHPELKNYAEYQLDSIAYQNEDAAEYIRLRNAMRREESIVNKAVFGYDVSAEQSARKAEEYIKKHPEFAEYRDAVYKFIDNLMQYRVDSGLISADQAAYIKSVYPHYIPVYREGDFNQKGANKKNVTVGKTIKRAVGGDQNILPLHAALSKQTMSVVREGSKNRFGGRLVTLHQTDGTNDIVKEHIKEVRESEYDVNENTFDAIEDPTPEFENTFTVRQDGKAYDIIVSPDVFEAVKSLAPSEESNNWIAKSARYLNTLYKSLITGYNPLFFARNAIRDIQDVGINSKDLSGFMKAYPLAWKEITTNGEWYQKYKAAGGLYSSVFDYKTGEKSGSGGVVNNIAKKIEKANSIVEQVPRLAEFISTMQSGDGSYENLMEALYNANEVTTNFGRAGTWGKFLNSNFVPFLNPSIQGFDKLIRIVAETKGIKDWLILIGKAAVFGAAPRLLNELLCGDEEDWDEIKERDKDIYYLIPKGDGEWIKINRGRTIAVIATFADAIFDVATEGETDIAGKFETAMSQVGPTNPLVENIARPLIDADLGNESSPGRTWYGTDIESERLQGYEPGQRYDEKTDVLSKWIGDKTGLSPKKINYLLDQYSGVIGDAVLPLLTPTSSDGMFRNAFTMDTVFSNNLSEEFYSLLDELEWAKNAETATGSDKAAYRYMYNKMLDVSDINKQIREAETSDRTQKAKQEEVEILHYMRNAIMREALDQYEAWRSAEDDYYELGTMRGDSEDEASDFAYNEANNEIFGAKYALEAQGTDVLEGAEDAVWETALTYEDYYEWYNNVRVKGGKIAEQIDAIAKSDLSDEAKSQIYYSKYATEKEREVMEMFWETGTPDAEMYDAVSKLHVASKAAEKRSILTSSKLTDYEQSLYYFTVLASTSQKEKLADLISNGITQAEYYDFLINTLDISGENKKAQILSYIDGTGMTSEEKDMLYLAAGYSESTIDDAPWHSGSFGGSGIFGTSSIFGDSGIFGSNNSIFGDSGIFGEKGIFG